MRGDLYKGKETFPHCQSLALRERWHFACEMTERVRHRRCRRFLVVAGVSASRAAKKALLGLFARRDASAVPQLFESTREGVTLGFCKRKRPAYFLRRSFLVVAGVSASRAAKKAPLGLFCPAGRKRRAAAVRIHPRGCDFGFLQKKKTSVFSTLVFLVGAGGFEQAALSPVASCLRSIQWFHAAFRTPTRTAVASTRTAVRIKVGYKVGYIASASSVSATANAAAASCPSTA